MLNKIICLVLCGACVFFLFLGCSQDDSIQSISNNAGAINEMNNCKLYVKGREITSKSYVWISHQNRNSELPLLAILNELGADISWENEHIVSIKIEETIVNIDTEMDDFGITVPPGTTSAVRKIVNGEIIMDGDSVNVLLKHIAGINVVVDYETSVIIIE